jgi:iron complex transport system permease protein
MEYMDNKTNYNLVVFRKKIIFFFLIATVIISFITDISTGPAQLSLMDVIRSLLNPDSIDKKTNIIVWIIRLPIATMAVLVGACLAIAGMEMQTILNNSLASPYTLGISSAASFGASLSLVFGNSLLPAAYQNFLTPIFAFVFSLGSSLLVYSIAKIRKDKVTIILMGIAVGFLFSALNSILTYFVRDEVLRGITNWAQGSILGATWQQNMIIFTVALLIVPLIVKDSWKLTALSMGDDSARSLGIRVDRLRTKILALTAIITSVAVCFVGTVGFIGLVAPYIAKALVGEEQRFYIPVSLLTGSLMLSVSSILSKTIIPGGQIPLGIITSIIGIPFLIMLVLKQGR